MLVTLYPTDPRIPAPNAFALDGSRGLSIKVMNPTLLSTNFAGARAKFYEQNAVFDARRRTYCGQLPRPMDLELAAERLVMMMKLSMEETEAVVGAMTTDRTRVAMVVSDRR